MDEKTKPFDFPFACPEGAREMMSTWCRPGMKFCECCPMGTVKKDEANGERAEDTAQTQEKL